MDNPHKIVLLDLEFTLIDTWGVIEHNALNLARAQGLNLSSEEIEAAVLSGKNQEVFGMDINTFWDRLNAVFDEEIAPSQARVYPETYLFLSRLKQDKDVTTAIFSDTPLERVHRYINHFGLDGGFAYVHGWLRERRHLHKPKLGLSMSVLNHVGYKAGDRVYIVGDNHSDIQAAEKLRENGIDARGILMDKRDIQPKPNADIITTSLIETADYILTV